MPSFKAPINLVMSARNRSAGVRIPMYSSNPKAKRLEFRCPDPSCNGYLLFTAMMMALIDGVKNKIDPGKPLDRDIYEMSPAELDGFPKAPSSLQESLATLQANHAFLTTSNVFTDDLIKTWIAYKTEHEVAQMKKRPHPYEFHLYYDN